jgi:DNA-binding beta-propeller fold protein YncE
VDTLSNAGGAMCLWMPVSVGEQNMARLPQQFLAQASTVGQKSGRNSVFLDTPPVRTVRDTYPTYAAVAVDTNSDEVYLQDENLTGYNVFDRLTNTPSSAMMTEPKRSVSGSKTRMDYNCGIYVDPKTGDVYSVNNDIVNTLAIFPRSARGNVEPMRAIQIPHRGQSLAVDEEGQELFVSIQHPPAIVVYHKMAKEDDAPLRIVEGVHTLLADPHGVAVDTKNQLLFVANYGSVSFSKGGQFLTPYLPDDPRTKESQGGPNPVSWRVPGTNSELNAMVGGSGKYQPPSIAVYPLKADGDTPPLRVIEGPKTQMNWPATLSIDPDRGELYVANDMGNSILVFSVTASGNAAPIRVVKGPKTRLFNPTGVFADLKNQELWVANMGNHSATVYPLLADGDAAPLRTIRSSPPDKNALMIGNPGAISFDSKREEILIPN